MQKPTYRLAELDLLRFLAAVSVVLFHCYSFRDNFGRIGLAVGRLGAVARFGYLGVELFFLISGFVIAMSAQSRTLRAFAVHRWLRLYPTFWAALGLTVTAVFAFGEVGEYPSFRNVIANATMLPTFLGEAQIDVVYWTLAVEIKFYALVGCALALSLGNSLENLAYVWLLLLIGCTVGLGGPVLKSVAIFPYGGLFAGGMILYFANRDGWTANRLAALLVSWFLSMLTLGRAPEAAVSVATTSSFDSIVVKAVITLSFLSIVAATVWSGRFGASKLFIQLGALTYPLYLTHQRTGQLLYLVFDRYVSPTIATACVLLIVFSLAWLIVVFVERTLVKRLAGSQFVQLLDGRLAQTTSDTIAARGLQGK